MSGNESEVVVDNVTISTNGSTTSSEFVTREDGQVALFVDGDSNSDDIDIVAEAKVRGVSGDSWAELDSSVSNDNLTNTNNNAKIYLYDVENSAKVRWVVDNNNGTNSTDVTAVASRQV